MRILLLNQTFHPDVVATAQYLTDAARALVAEGHDVTVLAGSSGYADPSRRFSPEEVWNGIRIVRIRSLRLAKDARWKRALDFGSYMAACAARLLSMGRFDVVVALTSPPLVSTLARWFVRLRGGRFVFWVMDLNPDASVAAGWLRQDSLAAKFLSRSLARDLARADAIVALDRFMRDRLAEKGAAPDRLRVVPLWSHDADVRFDVEARERFRSRHGLDGRFVVMYAGNHSPCNPLDTLLSAAAELRGVDRIHFCFVGGGSEFPRLKRAAESAGLPNVTFLPYEPRSDLSAVLSAADLHVASLGDAFVGVIHPSKVYNALRVGAPLLYLGPANSHIGDMASNGYRRRIRRVAHGDVPTAVDVIRAAAADGFGRRAESPAASPSALDQLVRAVVPVRG